MASRREFIVGSAAFAAAIPLLGQKPVGLSLWMGSCSPRGAQNGIYHSWFDTATGKATEPTLAAATPTPSFFCTMRDARGRLVLYSVNELDQNDSGVSSFVVDAAGGKLAPINHVLSGGAAPCYISARPATRTIYTANYNGSSISVFRAQPDGSITPAIQRIDLKDTARFGTSGPHKRQGMPHPHTVMMSPDQRFIIVNDLGNDSLDIFAIESDGRLNEAAPVLTKRPPATGPRHIAFHPNGKWVYGIDELNNTLQRYEWVEHGGSAELKPLPQIISTMQPNGPPPVPGEPLTASEVAVSPDGRFLYACTRGDDSLTVFSIAKDGGLSFMQRIGSGGKIPRQFTLDPSAGWIVCCNNNSPAVTIYRRDKSDGKLTGPVQTLAVDSPEFALFT